ncbi:MAG: FHA domain-containing protein [Pseudomonadota bacterium]
MLHALELNSSALIVATRDDAVAADVVAGANRVAVAASVPAVASFEGETVLTGDAAARRARLVPLWTSTRHFEELSVEPLPRTRPLARTSADLVYAQFAALVQAHPHGRWLLATPAAYDVAQLQLLLGIARAANLDVAGVVDAAVAACVDHPGAPRAFHLDLEAHRAILTELVRGEDLRRGRATQTRAAGRRACDDAFVQLLARLFVRGTRFDPLLQASTEQLLYDALPGWILRAEAEGEVAVALEHGGLRHETRLAHAQLVAAAAPINAVLLKLLHSARRAGETVTHYVTDRVAVLPGNAAELERLRDCEVVRLPAGGAARGALAHAGAIVASGSEEAAGASAELTRVNRLRGAAAVLPARRDDGHAADVADAPTHLVFQGRAYALSTDPLVIGRGGGGARRIAVDAGGALPGAGVSRSHCTLVARAGEVVLEDHSTWGTFVNGERVQRRARLRAGDRVRVGTPGAELDAVRLAG